MENYRDSIALSLEIKNLLLQLTDVYKVSASPYLEKVEDLAKQAVNRKKDYLAIVLELFRFEEKNELIEVILMNFVLKLMREFFDQIPSDNTSINELINSAVGIVRDSYSDPFFTSKMLEFLRQYFGLPLAYITLDNTRKIWKIVKSFLRIQEDFMAQMSHDMAIKSIKAFFGTLKQKGQELLSTETQEITLFILGELTKESAELITSLKKETQAASRKQQLKSLENLCSCLLFCLELLVDHDLTFLNDFLLEDILYYIMQLGEIEDSNILSLNLSFHSLFWKLKNNSFLDVRSLISTIFNQTIMRPLQRFSTKFLSGLIKERDIFNLHHLISYLIQFLQNKEYVNFVYAHNDLTSLKKPLYDQILVNVFKIAKKAAENTTQSYSREIFDIILEFLYGSLEIDESSTLHLENISQEDKEKFAKLLNDAQKWERDAALISEDPKKFLKRMDEYYSQESLEDKAEKIAYFLHLSHHVPSGKIIEILGLDKPLNREILKKYLVALDFTGLDIIKAMRLFFVNFLMFGEAQVVERVLAAFCGHYYACNSENGPFKSSGPVHTFTYAIIMLNTDLYKPILKEKMSVEAFVNNCRDLNDGDDLPEDFLRGCYNSLKQYEIKTLSSRDLSQEENVTQETWKNYLKTIQMYDSESARIYAKNDNFVDPKEIKDLELLIDYHCHKKIILKIIDNLDLFLAKGYQDPSSIDLLLDKIVKVCVHYEMLENLDNIMTSMDKKLESNPNFDMMKMSEQSLWNLFCAFLFMKKSLIYLQGSINIVAKLLVKTFSLRKYIADDKIAQKYLKRYRKIKQSSKFSSKAIYKNSSFFEAFLGFVSKEEVSSEEEDDVKVLQRVEYQNRGTMDKLTLHKKYYNEYNIFEEIYDQTKFLPDQHIVRFFNVLISDPEILEATQKDPNLLISLNANLFEVAARNYDRPHIFWSALASGFIQLSLVESKGKQTDQAQRDKLNQLFKLDDNKLGALFEPLFQKKTRKLTTMKLFIHYSLLELCLEFCHNTKDLVGFEEVLNYLLECLTEYSIPILFEFIKMIQEVVNSYQFTESQNLTNWIYLLRIMRKMLEAIEKNSTGVVEVKDICLQYAEVLNDIVLKLSFLTDNDFTETLRELTELLVRFHNSEVAKQFQLISKVINNFYLLIVGIEKKKANDYLKATPELIYSVYDLAHKFVLENSSVEIGLALKLFQKVLYILNLDTTTTDEQLNHILTKLNEIKKKLVTQNDENLCLAYVEMLRKFLLSHIEKVQPSGQLQMMLSFYEQSYEIYKMSVDKKYETLVETLIEYLNNTTNVLVGLNILGGQGEGNGNLYQAIYDIIDKFPKQKIEEKVEEKVEAKSETKIEEKPEEKVEEKAEEKIEQKTEEKSEEKPEEKVEPKAEEKVEAKTEPNGASQEEVPPKESS